MRWLLALLMGAGLGLMAGVADTAVGTDPGTVMVALDVVTDTVAVWALVAVLGGWLVARRPHAAFGGVVTLFGGLAAWTLWTATQPGESLSLDMFSAEARAWILLGIVVSPLLGLLGAVARSNSVVGLCARICAPIALVVEILWRHQASSENFTVDPVVAWTAVLMVIAGVLMTAIAVVGSQRSSAD
jgi:hypothetical protein